MTYLTHLFAIPTPHPILQKQPISAFRPIFAFARIPNPFSHLPPTKPLPTFPQNVSKLRKSRSPASIYANFKKVPPVRTLLCLRVLNLESNQLK
jgi:hypothetical protein